MAQNQKSKLDTTYLYAKLKYKHILSEKLLKEKHPGAFEFFESKGFKPGKIRQHAARILTSGALASSLLFVSPQMTTVINVNQNILDQNQNTNVNQNLSTKLAEILPKKIEQLTIDQETAVSHLLHEAFGITAVPKLGSTKLNNIYGNIGAEQHLPRYPGDTISQHDAYQKLGITPGLGGWGYFARSKSQMTEGLYLKEKYYVAVQTLYLPDWHTRLKFLVNWYKYRKVVVVNPVNGKTIVAVVADAGPSWWTGKHFGGSPEVMAYLRLNVGMQKGPVVLYFVDDPEDKVPLGPLEYNLNKESLIALK